MVPVHLNPARLSAETRLLLPPVTTGLAYSTKSSIRTGHAPKGKQKVLKNQQFRVIFFIVKGFFHNPTLTSQELK